MRLPLSKRWKKVPKWKKYLILALIVLLIGGAAWAKITGWPKEDQSEPEKPHYSQLTGNKVSESTAKQPILGVMIENSPMARPQTGLSSAGIVFEAVTEGGITRYLALFQEDTPELVGPVRSVRPHFVAWAGGFDASIAHVGGSTDALEMITRNNLKTLNQFRYSEPYFRSSDRQAPHNMYARVKDLINLQSDLEHQTSQMTEILRSQDSPSEQPDAKTIRINFSSVNYVAEFRYDPDSNNYTRYLAGQPDIDAATDQPITVKNLIVIKMSNIRQATGSGEAIVYKDGTAVKGTWRQSDLNKRLMLFDENNSEIPLNRGNSWFAALPPNGQLTVN